MPETAPSVFPSVQELAARLPQYEVVEMLSLGEGSAVYAARQPALNRQVELTVMREPEAEIATRLLERLRLRARLVHPLVAAVYDFGHTADGLLYWVSEHVEGHTVLEWIEAGNLKTKTAFSAALQLCEALQIVHDLPCAHGALAPHTVWLTADGKVKLTGIGMTVTDTGELSWLAPFHGSREQDLYALGYTLHWMFAKSAPGEDGRLARDLPPAFATVLRRCLNAETGRPFQSPAEVGATLKEALLQEQARAEGTARSRMVVAPAGQGGSLPASSQPPASSATSAARPAPTPRSPASGSGIPLPPRPQPVVRHYQPTFFQRLDAFVWKAFSTGLHIAISLASVAAIFLLVLFKDRIVFEDNSSVVPKMTQEEIEKAAAVQDRLPGGMLGGLSPVPELPVAPTPEQPVVMPLAEKPVDPLADLRAQYTAAVQAAANRALEKVSLDELPYLQRELTLLQSGGDVPADDEPELPAVLKALRQRYREALAGRISQGS